MSTLVLYMKSGNIIKVTHVEKWSFKSSGDDIEALTIVKTPSTFRKARGLLLSTLNLGQIEAVEKI